MAMPSEDSLLNLATIFVVYYSYQWLSGSTFLLIVMILVGVKIWLMDADLQREAEEATNLPRVDPDKVKHSEELNWLNILLKQIWLNYRGRLEDYMKNEVWPKVQEEIDEKPWGAALGKVELTDFNIGEHPLLFKWIRTEDKMRGHPPTDEFVIEVMAKFRCNGKIGLVVHQGPIQIPMSIDEITVPKIHMRFVIKGISSMIPFMTKVGITFMEEPSVDWTGHDLAKITDMPGISHLIDFLISKAVRKEMVWPNELEVPVELKKSTKDKINQLFKGHYREFYFPASEDEDEVQEQSIESYDLEQKEAEVVA